jgi:hypothetical protein
VAGNNTKNSRRRAVLVLAGRRQNIVKAFDMRHFGAFKINSIKVLVGSKKSAFWNI